MEIDEIYSSSGTACTPMRYYDIQLSGGKRWTSHPYGSTPADPNAQEVLLNLELHAPTEDPDNKIPIADNNSTLEIKGVAWEEIKTSNQLVGQTIKISGGMMPGLPLATYQSKNAGLLVTGRIQKCWGNWVGTEMSLGMALTNDVENAGGQGPSGGNAGNASSGSPGAGNAGSGGPPAPQMALNGFGTRSLSRIPLPRADATAVALSTVIPTLTSTMNSLLQGAANVNVNGLISSFTGGGFPGLLAPLNVIHDWQPNTPLMQAVQKTLST